MAISTAVQKGNNVYVYDENNNQRSAHYGGTLMGFTSTTVSVKKGNAIYVYDERGNQKQVHYT